VELGVGGPGKGAQATKRSPCLLPIQEDSMLMGMSEVMLHCFPFRAIDIDYVESHGVQKTCSPCPYLIAKLGVFRPQIFMLGLLTLYQVKGYPSSVPCLTIIIYKSKNMQNLGDMRMQFWKFKP
jgi:hypothetical protein